MEKDGFIQDNGDLIIKNTINFDNNFQFMLDIENYYNYIIRSYLVKMKI